VDVFELGGCKQPAAAVQVRPASPALHGREQQEQSQAESEEASQQQRGYDKQQHRRLHPLRRHQAGREMRGLPATVVAFQVTTYSDIIWQSVSFQTKTAVSIQLHSIESLRHEKTSYASSQYDIEQPIKPLTESFDQDQDDLNSMDNENTNNHIDSNRPHSIISIVAEIKSNYTNEHTF